MPISVTLPNRAKRWKLGEFWSRLPSWGAGPSSLAKKLFKFLKLRTPLGKSAGQKRCLTCPLGKDARQKRCSTCPYQARPFQIPSLNNSPVPGDSTDFPSILRYRSFMVPVPKWLLFLNVGVAFTACVIFNVQGGEVCRYAHSQTPVGQFSVINFLIPNLLCLILPTYLEQTSHSRGLCSRQPGQCESRVRPCFLQDPQSRRATPGRGSLCCESLQ